MNGILVVQKSKGMTSRDVVNEVSKILKTKKIGHTGTLDPLATGVLVLCIGKGTKLAELITAYQKEYIAEVILGLSTDTLDVTGNILREEKVDTTVSDIDKALSFFRKKYMQEVPLYSAVKINGKKLYEYAREKKEICPPKREVTIFDIERRGDVIYKDGKVIFSFWCKVSKGTYIRSLIRDIASFLCTYGSMKSLCRIKQGKYDLKNAYSLEDIQNGNYQLLPISSAFEEYKKIVVSKQIEEKIKNGSILENIYSISYPLFVNEKGDLLALYKPYQDHFIKPFKMLIDKEDT